MAINNTFYSTINDLVSVFTTGTNPLTHAIVDYASFVDAGRVLADLDADQLANGFLAPLMNKVQLSIDTFRSYDPSMMDMYKGSTDGGVIEMITHTFYNVRQAPFVNLTNAENDSMIDFKKPEVNVRYYTDENAWQSYISITDTQLRAAWRSPGAMEAFIAGLLGDMSNTNKLYRETARFNTLNARIDDIVTTETATTTLNTMGQYIDLVAVYNSFVAAGDKVTDANALMTPAFVRWAVSYMNDFKYWMEKPSTVLNSQSVMTFTPRRSQRTKISTVFDSAIRRSLWDIYHTEGALLGDYEVLPFWQNRQSVNTVMVAPTATSATKSASSNVVGVIYDEYALGEYLNLESVTSERNNKKLYTTYYYNYIMRYITNENANFVVFTLGTATQPASA